MRFQLTANQKNDALRQDGFPYAGVHDVDRPVLGAASLCRPLPGATVLLAVVAECLSAIGIGSLWNIVLCERIPLGLLSN